MRVGIFGKKHQQCIHLVEHIFSILKEYDVEIHVHQTFLSYLRDVCPSIVADCLLLDKQNPNIHLAISIGGDGSFLKTASFIGPHHIPILGINTGRLGFLADITEETIDTSLREVLQNKFTKEERMVLEMSRSDKLNGSSRYALNEIAVLKQDTAAMLTIHTSVNGEYLTGYQSDGLIIATPTGSTAYSLSVGGPIMSPDTPGLILAPIAPHSLNVRPLVVNANSVIKLEIESRSNAFLVSTDGFSSVLRSSVSIEVKKAHFCISLAQTSQRTFFHTLREKLMWGIDIRKSQIR